MKKIVVVVRCYNEEKNIERFIRGYSFADKIIISDGGSTDNSLAIIQKYEGERVKLIHFDEYIIRDGERWNPDNSHINYVLDAGKEEKPDWLLIDDMDCVPNKLLRENARELLEKTNKAQINLFRLYLWGDTQFFPYLNRDFNPDFMSFWAWNPDVVNIRADLSQHHGTYLGMASPDNIEQVFPPYSILHKSWYPDTVNQKIERYRKVGIAMSHPLQFAGQPQDLPEWAVE